jgi:hypothetical protein
LKELLTIIISLFLNLHLLSLLHLFLELLHLLLNDPDDPIASLLLDLSHIDLDQVEDLAVVRDLVHGELLELPQRRDVLLALVQPLLQYLHLVLQRLDLVPVVVLDPLYRCVLRILVKGGQKISDTLRMLRLELASRPLLIA